MYSCGSLDTQVKKQLCPKHWPSWRPYRVTNASQKSCKRSAFTSGANPSPSPSPSLPSFPSYRR